MTVLTIRDIETIKAALKVDQMARHPYLRDYTPLSVLSTLNETYAIQVQYLEQRANDAIEATSIWTATGTNLDNLVGDRGISRQAGLISTGSILFSSSSPVAQAITIPIGTVVNSISGDGNKICFTTTEVGTINIGTTNISVDGRAVKSGTDGNVPEYSISQMVNYIPGISRVENLLPFTGGTQGETDEELRERYKYAIDINGKATLQTLEQKIADLESVRECQIWQKYAGEIETVIDTVEMTHLDQTIVDCLRVNMAAGIVSKGKTLGSITSGVVATGISIIEAGKLYLRVESEYISTNENVIVTYTDTTGSTTSIANFLVLSGSVKGDLIVSDMIPVKFAVSVNNIIYIGSSSYSILGGIGTYPYLYILPRLVTTNVIINIK
jgi:hypothetical protein